MRGDPVNTGKANATFAQALETLKTEGSSVLLVGSDSEAAHTAACRRLLGDNTTERYRLFVTDGEIRNESHARKGGPVRTVDYTSLGSSQDEIPISQESVISALGIAVIETIDELECEAGGLDPSELRVCIDSLVRLLEEHSAETVFRLLHILTWKVTHSNGMGHVHLPLERDHDAVNLFEPLFDAIIEVRSAGRDYEHRWELRDQGPTDWVPIAETDSRH